MTTHEASDLPEVFAEREGWHEEQWAQWRRLRQKLADLTLNADTAADAKPVYTIEPDAEYRSVVLYRDSLLYDEEVLDPDDTYPLVAAAHRLLWKVTALDRARCSKCLRFSRKNEDYRDTWRRTGDSLWLCPDCWQPA
jgi:hypothetical protein